MARTFSFQGYARQITVTMTPTQSETWTLGGHAADAMVEEIAAQLEELHFQGTATVLVDDGSVAFCLEVGL